MNREGAHKQPGKPTLYVARKGLEARVAVGHQKDSGMTRQVNRVCVDIRGEKKPAIALNIINAMIYILEGKKRIQNIP